MAKYIGPEVDPELKLIFRDMFREFELLRRSGRYNMNDMCTVLPIIAPDYLECDPRYQKDWEDDYMDLLMNYKKYMEEFKDQLHLDDGKEYEYQ